LSVAALFVGACAQVNNPWQDSGALVDGEMQTASSVGSTGKSEFGRPHRRVVGQSLALYENCAVTHWPLWFEDPFEDRGNTDIQMTDPTTQRDLPDNQFAMNWVDYMHMAYGPGRELLNIVSWPVSAVVTPPGTVMESDGCIDKGLLGYDHDAKRTTNPNREPPFANDVNKHSIPYEATPQEQPPAAEPAQSESPPAESPPAEQPAN
jgi:hypothetical protein